MIVGTGLLRPVERFSEGDDPGADLLYLLATGKN
jgi:hypothetical protein